MPRRTAPCNRCGKPMASTSTSLPAGQRRCQPCRKVEPVRVRSTVTKDCLTCGKTFSRPKWQRRTYCSTACSNRRSVDPASPMLDRQTRYVAKSRARRLRHALTWDGVSDQQILDRDGWRCHICHRKIRTTYTNPHPKSPSIDHIVPLSEGGDDTAANKRAAHLDCNMARSNHGGHEQLALIGWFEPTPLVPEVRTGMAAARRVTTRAHHNHPHACDPRCGGTAMTHLRPGVPRTWDEAALVLAAHRASQGRGAGSRRDVDHAVDRQ